MRTPRSVSSGAASAWGEAAQPRQALRVDYAVTGEADLELPAGEVRLVVSRGYEYEILDQVAIVPEGETLEVTAVLEHSVDTTDVMCGDFHIHTRRSADAVDPEARKIEAAVAEGLEIPVQSEHEYVSDFQNTIARLGLTEYAFGLGSIELSSMETWGHMGVFPLVPSATEVNGGAPLWQEFPDVSAPERALRTLSPREVFEAVRMRPERPTIIINHPLGRTNYFGYCGYDPVTGMVERAADWDESFGLVEVWNDADWLATREGTVRSWLSLLDHGRRVFAVGSSDSHSLSGSPVGYPRTCIRLGTDEPSRLTPEAVRDALVAGHATVSGGIYVDAEVAGVGPGDEASGLGMRARVRVRIQAASWVDVDAFDLVVDGETVSTVEVLETDRDPTNPAIRFDAEVDIDVASVLGYVVVAAYGNTSLDPVHPGRIPFGETNPIFLRP